MLLRNFFCATSSSQLLLRHVFRGAAYSSAQTSASLHPPAALRLRFLPFTRDMGVHGLCGRVPDSAGNACPPAFVCPPDCVFPSDCYCSDIANLSAHLHRLPTPPPYLRRMRLSPGRVRSSCNSSRTLIPLSPPLEHKKPDFVRGFIVRFYYLV